MRLTLLSRLKDGDSRSVIQLAEGTGLTSQGIRKHLSVLESAGLVARESIGRESRFVYQPSAIEKTKQHLERASAQWDNAVARLKNLVEDE